MVSYMERLKLLLPHYAAIIILILLVFAVLDLVVPELGTIGRLAIAAVIAIAYPLVLRRLGRAPEPWA